MSAGDSTFDTTRIHVPVLRPFGLGQESLVRDNVKLADLPAAFA